MKKLTYLSLIGVSLLVFSFIVFRSDLAEEIVLLDILTIEEVDPVVEEPIFEEESSGLLSTDPISDPIEEPKQEVEEAVDSGH
ncbi:MAG: hypothetical protein LBD11_01150 [Candidatus Peribacteria bacterium]|jgi:hypothetical protein|nr:hypothetical protein [Candidatus Peribacteria bacterium]